MNRAAWQTTIRATALLLACFYSAQAWADGGLLRLSETVGSYRIAAFTDPTPLRAGNVDLSVWVQAIDSPALLEPAAIRIVAKQVDRRLQIAASATREAATNKLLQAAQLELPAAGVWRFEITIRQSALPNAEPMVIAFDAEVAEPLPRWRELATWIFWPFIPIGLFGLHIGLSARRGRPTGLRAR